MTDRAAAILNSATTATVAEMESVLALSDEGLSGGNWVTINGAHIYIKDGVAVAGPSHLIGKPHAGHANAMSAKTESAPTRENHRAAAEAHSDVATAALKAGDQKNWEKHADEAFAHYGHAEGWHETDGVGSGWPAEKHDEAATAESGSAKSEAFKGNPAKAATHSRFSGKHKKMAASVRAKTTQAQNTANAASDEAHDHSYIAGIGNSSAVAHTKASEAHDVAAKAQHAVGNHAAALHHAEEAGNHQRWASKAQSMGLSVDAIILDAGTLPVAKEVPGGLEGLPTSEDVDDESAPVGKDDKGNTIFAKRAVPIAYYVKEALRTPGDGKKWTRRAIAADGQAKQFGLTREDIETTVGNFKDRLSAGIRPFIPDSHVENRIASANNGEIIDAYCRPNADGTHSLMTKLKVVGTAGQEKVLKNDVSVYLVNGNDQLVVDARGKKYDGWVLHHLALTPNPNQPHLEPFQRIAASADGPEQRDVPVYQYVSLDAEKGGTTMCTPEELKAAKDHLATMGEGTADMTPDNAMGKVMEHAKKMHGKHMAAKAVMALSADADLEPVVKQLKTDLDATKTALATATGALDTEKQKVIALSASDPDALTPWNLSAFTMNAESLRERCVATGKISAADAKAYSSIFRDAKDKPMRIALTATCENGHPAELNFWRITAGLSDTIRTGAGISRVPPTDATAADLSLALSAEAIREGAAAEEKMRPDMIQRMRQNLGIPLNSSMDVVK